MKNIDIFLSLTKEIQSLWERYSGFNKDLYEKYQELDVIFQKIAEEGKKDILVEQISNKNNNLYEKVILAKFLYPKDKVKSKELLNFVLENGTGVVRLLARSLAMNA